MDKNARISYAGNDYWNYAPSDGSEETLVHEGDLRAEGMLKDAYVLACYDEAYAAWKEYARGDASTDTVFFTYPCPWCERPTSYSAEDMEYTVHTHGCCNECWVLG